MLSYSLGIHERICAIEMAPVDGRGKNVPPATGGAGATGTGGGF